MSTRPAPPTAPPRTHSQRVTAVANLLVSAHPQRYADGKDFPSAFLDATRLVAAEDAARGAR